MREFHTIVEYSYLPKKQLFIIRFLDGTCLRVPLEHLPKQYQNKSAEWQFAEPNKEKTALFVKVGKKKVEIPAFEFYAAGKIV